MTTLTLKFEGVYEQVINNMLSSKMVKTKTEAVRFALLNFGLNTGMINDETVLDAIQNNLAKSSRAMGDIKADIDQLKHETICRYSELHN
ncbi:MAG: hypothetical protein MSIBF_07320 [Candidatus Altiarchaeales archaeon IMC4]|nr:MAG: hypothetical protein MSIBF_07320 [Candidatus Altiarchaeales archaeon IMC4]